MSTYVYACKKCRKQFEVVKPMAESSRQELHCGVVAERVYTSPQIIGAFQPYKAIGAERRMINTRQEHKDYLRQYGYEEVGNDLSHYPTETDAERETRERETYGDVKQIEEVAAHID